MVDELGPRSLTVVARSKLCSLLQCVAISSTRLHCCSQKRHLNVCVSGSLASSTMLPTELASESLYAILRSLFSAAFPLAIADSSDTGRRVMLRLLGLKVAQKCFWLKFLRLVLVLCMVGGIAGSA
jgi:hypothetical protein